ncbi:WD repeat-containing protein 91 [Dipsacomyces acuminosporus]|nr:WD repeat-containing protein 91 [Dipsacomyces acuminosporus]
MNTSSNLMSRQLVFEKRHPWVQNMLCSPVSSSILTISSTKPEGTTDISLRIWDASANKTASSKRLLTSPESHGVCAAFNHNGNLLALAYSTGNVRLLDTRSFETVASIATKQSSVCAAEFRFDEDSLMVVSEVGKLTQWSLRKDSHMVAETQLSLGSGLSGNAVPADSRLDCDRVVFTPDREHVLVAPNNQCMVFNVDSAALTDTMRHHKDLVTCIDFAVDRSLSASDDGTIRVAKFRNV